ncbi:MAG: cation:proton antiporter [Bdellovibrionales bacterium]|nr:cation:proton antiporter [Bdellovibrionales bacterium]
MQYSTEMLPVLGLILFFGLLVPSFFKWFHLPFATSLIWTGFIVGPNSLNYISPNDTLRMFGFVGANFLMLLAGFETPEYRTRIFNKKGTTILFFSGFLPALIGFLIPYSLDFSLSASLFVSAMFLTSSNLISFSTVEHFGGEEGDLESTVRPLVAFLDLSGAMLAFLIFKYIEPHHRFSLPILLGLLISLIVVLRLFLTEVVTYFFHKFSEKREHESRLRLIISLLLMVTFLFSMLDVPSIISSFLVGYCLSSINDIDDIKDKLKTIGYGFFVPIFLFLVGLDLDFSFISEIKNANFVFLGIVIGAILSKVVFGLIGFRLTGFPLKDSFVFGLLSSTRLTVTISVGYIAYQMQVIDSLLYTSLISITAITTLFMPPLSVFVNRIGQGVRR